MMCLQSNVFMVSMGMLICFVLKETHLFLVTERKTAPWVGAP
jgi:hypothetical protein